MPNPTHYRLVVYGEAKPHGVRFAVIPRKGGGRPFLHKYTDKKVSKWESSIRESAKKIYKGLLEGPLGVDFSVYLKRPKSRPKKDKHPDRRPDLDNLLKSSLDGVKGILFRDDGQICKMLLWKFYALENEAPRIEMEIFKL